MHELMHDAHQLMHDQHKLVACGSAGRRPRKWDLKVRPQLLHARNVLAAAMATAAAGAVAAAAAQPRLDVLNLRPVGHFRCFLHLVDRSFLCFSVRLDVFGVCVERFCNVFWRRY